MSANLRSLGKVLLFVWLGLSAPTLSADSVFRVDIAYGGAWHDAEKSKREKNDDWLCWAATAANVLAWTGWSSNTGLETEDDIFHYFSQHWTDHPEGSPREAWRWWFTGKTPTSGGAKVTQEGGGFWPNVKFPISKWGTRKGSIFRGIGQNQLKQNPYLLKHTLEDGYGVVLQIVRPKEDGSRDSHMITLWGFRYDSQEPFKGILVTDSDDGKDTHIAKDSLVYYPVELREGQWWFRYREQSWKILAAYALQARSRYRH